MKEHQIGTFSEQLQAWRLQRGLTQAQLDVKLGRTSTFVRNLEAGVNKPPDFAMCKLIAEALGLHVRVVWDAAREQRLRAFDEDLYRHYVLGERVDELPVDSSNPDERPWNSDETFLVQTLRWLDEDVPHPDGEPLAGLLEDALVTLFIAGEPGPGPAAQTTALAREAVHALQRFSELSVNKQAALLRVFAAAVAAAEPDPVARGVGRGDNGSA
jgi:transcriptional regulator with XRE-family HTH domain